MREIKFDAIYKPTGEHFIYHEISFRQRIITGNFDGKINDWCHFSLDGKYGDAILRQYTGLKDKNGREIYEGDILDDKEDAPLYIEYNEDKASFCFVDKFDPYGIEYYTTKDLHFEDMKVIGNIYENPELLRR